MDEVKNWTMEDYHMEAMKNKVYGYGDKIVYPTLGVGNEAGELQGKVKKVLRDNNGVYTPEAIEGIIAELGDVLWYVAAVADDLDFSLNEVADYNIKKLQDRRNRGVIKGSGDNR